ncbi:MAG: GNAT family N-acetyltransferase [Candidatus Nanohaloarchaea archaeon]
MVKIRGLRPEDAEDLEEVTRRSWIEGQEDFLTDEEISTARDSEVFEKTEEGIKEKRDSDKSIILVAEEDDRVVGRIRFSWDTDAHNFVEDEVQLRSLYVHPDYWRQGIATKLQEEGLLRIPDGFNSVVVEVFEANEEAVKFYRDTGFEKYDTDSLGPKDIDLLNEERKTLRMRRKI